MAGVPPTRYDDQHAVQTATDVIGERGRCDSDKDGARPDRPRSRTHLPARWYGLPTVVLGPMRSVEMEIVGVTGAVLEAYP